MLYRHFDQVHVQLFTPTIPPSDTNGKTGNGSSIHFTEELRRETLLPSREILRLNSKPSIILI